MTRANNESTNGRTEGYVDIYLLPVSQATSRPVDFESRAPRRGDGQGHEIEDPRNGAPSRQSGLPDMSRMSCGGLETFVNP